MNRKHSYWEREFSLGISHFLMSYSKALRSFAVDSIFKDVCIVLKNRVSPFRAYKWVYLVPIGKDLSSLRLLYFPIMHSALCVGVTWLSLHCLVGIRACRTEVNNVDVCVVCCALSVTTAFFL